MLLYDMSKNNLSIVLSYHDLNIVNFQKMFSELSSLSYDIYPLNNNCHTTQTLIDLRQKYDYDGVCFDEFNSQAYFMENIKDNNEYVYHTHYRRYLKLSDDGVDLKERTIYTAGYTKSLTKLLQMIFEVNIGCEFKDEYLIKTISVFARAMDISYKIAEGVMMSDSITPVREMYICHKDLQKRLVECTYKAIELICDAFDEEILKKKRFVGYMIELFQGFFFKKIYFYDGYECWLFENKVI